MTFIEILLIAVSLCFDTLAVSLVGGACIKGCSLAGKVKICLFFALFQGGFTFLGWLLGATVSSYVESFDHWVAFALLAWIGGKMVKDSFGSEKRESEVNLLDTPSLCLASAATSIDAFAVGISFAMSGGFTLTGISFSCGLIAAVTALSAAVGLGGGSRIGALMGPKCNLAGGLVLIAIGIKILLEHLL